MSSAEEIWMGPTGTFSPVPKSTWIRILPWRICFSSKPRFSSARVFSRCAARPADRCSRRARAAGGRSSSTARWALPMDCTSCSAWPKSCGMKIWLMASSWLSGKATSWSSLMHLGSSGARCCLAMRMAWIFSSTRCSRRLTSRRSSSSFSFCRQRARSASTSACQDSMAAAWRWYQPSLNSCMPSSSCSSSTSMRDCSSVLPTSTSRMGSTSRSKTKRRSLSSTCVEASMPVFCGL
mmetsp:Transcript_10030/g.30679  ORF Transcript_10030/g.30679 Transcript_10030/m.30679 type:complete len:237 (+) Transcript_10030:772-1482(+)